MASYHSLFLGAGRLAQYFFQQHCPQGWGIVRRTPGPLINLCGDLNSFNLKSWEPVNLVVIALTPNSGTQAAYDDLYYGLIPKILTELRYQRVIFISSTRVYAESYRSWVDEGAELSSEWGARALLFAEQLVRQESFSEHIIIRASGLYGTSQPPPSSWSQNDRWANRLHYIDLARLLHFCIGLPGPVQLTVNATDHHPFIPSQIAPLFSKLSETPVRSQPRPLKNHKISNLLSRSLGFSYLYPSVIQAYHKENPSVLI